MKHEWVKLTVDNKIIWVIPKSELTINIKRLSVYSGIVLSPSNWKERKPYLQKEHHNRYKNRYTQGQAEKEDTVGAGTRTGTSRVSNVDNLWITFENPSFWRNLTLWFIDNYRKCIKTVQKTGTRIGTLKHK